MSERPGEGLRGVVGGRRIQITSRKKLLAQRPIERNFAANRRRTGMRRRHRRSLCGHVAVS